MATSATLAKKLPLTAVLIGLATLAVMAVGLVYLSRPAAPAAESQAASDEAKSYLKNLQLSDVNMQATENFMKQQVVEIQGKIANHGPRKLASIEVFCLFYGADRKEIHRERLTVVHGLASQETRAFRLPFDSLPDGWDQAMPKMVIAQIAFSN